MASEVCDCHAIFLRRPGWDFNLFFSYAMTSRSPNSPIVILVFYSYPKQIRASVYSTNMIESFNNVIKRKAKPKAEFPTEQSLNTFIDIQAMSYNERYFNRIHKGFGQVQDTLESYFD